MAVVELRDRDVLARFCRRRPAVHAYELGDLDDFFWPHTRWLGWQPDGGVEQVALLYDEPDPPVLLAFAEEPGQGMLDLLRSVAADLPGRLYAHLSPALVDALSPDVVPSAEPVPHCKLGLVDPTPLERHDTARRELLAPSQLAEIDAFYGARIPGRGSSRGCSRPAGTWASAGTASSRAWPASTSGRPPGGVACARERRDRSRRSGGPGLATAACARLCRVLLDDGIDVDLAQRPRGQRRGDPGVREARLRPRRRLRRGAAHRAVTRAGHGS